MDSRCEAEPQPSRARCPQLIPTQHSPTTNLPRRCPSKLFSTIHGIHTPYYGYYSYKYIYNKNKEQDVELKIQVPDLVRALQRVQGIIQKKATMPILVNVLLRADEDGRLHVAATDLDTGLRASYPAEVKLAGTITVGAKALFDIVRSLPGETVRLKSLPNQWIELSAGKVQYRLVGMAADSYPSIPEFNDAEFFAIDARVFRDMIDRTIYAVSQDETRFNLTGVYCEAMAGGKGLRMVATDGHRLALVERPVDQAPPLEHGVIIPRKGLLELRKLLEENAEGQLSLVENSAVFRQTDVTLTMRLVDGKFPDYQQVVPTSYARKLQVDRSSFLGALKRTSLLAPDKAQGVRLEIDKDVLFLSANNPDLGEAREELDIAYDGAPLTIGFNFRYLMDALQVIPDDQIQFELTDELSPGVLRGVGSEGSQSVIMPMRI